MPSSFVLDTYTLIRDDQASNKRLIISSHGGVGGLADTFRTQIDLCFFTHLGVTTARQLMHVPVMSDRDFDIEPAGTSGVNDHLLSWYEHDQPADFAKVIDKGFDVVTIQRERKVRLSTIHGKAVELGYQRVYCLFCRVIAPQRIRVMF